MRFEFNDDSQKICNSADVVNYGIQCDICGNKVLSVSNINGKRYCAGCYYKTFMKDNQKAEIDQLKQQLAEKDKEIERLKQELEETNAGYDFTYEQSTEAINELKQNQTQLAIAELEKIINIFEPYENDNRDTILQLNNNVSFIDYIEQRIKELKGE